MDKEAGREGQQRGTTRGENRLRKRHRRVKRQEGKGKGRNGGGEEEGKEKRGFMLLDPPVARGLVQLRFRPIPNAGSHYTVHHVTYHPPPDGRLTTVSDEVPLPHIHTGRLLNNSTA